MRGGMAEEVRSNEADPLRRRALWGLFATAGAVGAAGVAGMVTYLWPRRVRRSVRVIDAGPVADYAVGAVQHAPDEGFFVVRRPDGFVAFSHTCTHGVPEPCPVDWRPDMEFSVVRESHGTSKRFSGTGWFRCPCHGATYDRTDGDAAFGPAERPLDTLPLQIESGRVRVTIGPGRAHRREFGVPPPVTPAADVP